MKIAEAASDERGALAFGKKGDQKGGEEVRIRTMTGTETGSAGFEKILRYPDTAVRIAIASDALEIALNDHYGYAQYGAEGDPYAGRYGIWTVMHEPGFKSFAKVQVDCNCDCSQLVSCALNNNGIKCSQYMRTATEIRELTALGFEELPYSAGSCLRGDVVWRNGHTAIVVDAPIGEGGELMYSAKKTSSAEIRLWASGAGPKTRKAPYIKVKRSEIGFVPNVIVIQQLGEVLSLSQYIRGQAHMYVSNEENDAKAGVAVGKYASYFNPDAAELVIPVRYPEREYIVRIYP